MDVQPFVIVEEAFRTIGSIISIISVGGIIKIIEFVYKRRNNSFNSFFDASNHLNSDKEARRVLDYCRLNADNPSFDVVTSSKDTFQDPIYPLIAPTQLLIERKH